MRLLFISGVYPPKPSGESDIALHYSRRLAARGVKVDVLTGEGEVLRDAGFDVHALMRDWSWLDLPRFVKVLRQISPDRILLEYIGWIYNWESMITFAPTVVRKVLPGVPFVTMFTNASGVSYVKRREKPFRNMLSWFKPVSPAFGTLLCDSDRAIVLSDLHRAVLAREWPAISEKTVLIPPPPLLAISPEDNGATRRRARVQLQAKPDDFLLVFFGCLYRGKGIETLLQAARLLRDRQPKLRLAVVGALIPQTMPDRPHYDRELQAMANDLGIGDRVTWTGYYPADSDLGSVYLRGADACVLPFDGGVALNNSSFSAAVSHGLPVISTQGPELEKAFRHGENVFLCPPKDSEALAAAIESVVGDATLRARLSAGAQEMAREWFSWDRAVDRTLAAVK